MPDKISIYDVGDRYDPSESEGEYDERERKLLTKIRDRKKGKPGQYADGEEEVLGFEDDDEDDDDGEYEDEEEEDDDFDEIKKFEHDSDIEDKEDLDDLPDRKAWGSKARNFYGADYVDQDYDSLTAQEEERARLEEIEAKEIQQRLAKELNEADFSLDVFVTEHETEAAVSKSAKKKKKESAEIKLTTDLSDLSDRQKRELFRKEAPEFDGLVEDFEKNLQECQEVLEPVMSYLSERNITDEHPFVMLLKTRYDLSLNYCNNISFYLLLKAKKVKIQNHPVVKRMVQMKQLLLELEQKYENSIKPQVETILEHIASGEELSIEGSIDDQPEAEQPKKKKLNILKEIEANEELEQKSDSYESDESIEDAPQAKKRRTEDSSEEEEQEPEEDQEEESAGDAKRKITYQMAKNKGLTPHKRKDERNIRVKNRRKFQKALVRRKGTVRPVRTETTRYAGESSGIKAYVKRSIKIK
ncbi:something about silencing protein 10 [Sabethes cyaneus]|uniref:something about silencing protein 10 n=1 Tax=Sabethes cyaneus TaxID=53552 RepID=UPI00237D6406|nr:something about silencing protein 10 [Sabethes cyaneus]